MHRLLATLVMVLMVPVPAIAQRLNPQYIISSLNQNIDNYKVLRNRGDITAQEYFDRSWKAYDIAAEDGNMPDLRRWPVLGG